MLGGSEVRLLVYFRSSEEASVDPTARGGGREPKRQDLRERGSDCIRPSRAWKELTFFSSKWNMEGFDQKTDII